MMYIDDISIHTVKSDVDESDKDEIPDGRLSVGGQRQTNCGNVTQRLRLCGSHFTSGAGR